MIERAAILAQNSKLVFDLPEADHADALKTSNHINPSDDDTTILTAAEIAELERRNIRRALDACGGRVSGAGGAAELIGMKPTTLYSRVKMMT